MSTFFEKLTGPQGGNQVDLSHAHSGKGGRKIATEEHEKRPTRIQIDTGEAGENPEEETPETEEGELTVDVYHKPDAIIIQSTVAGVKPEDLDVSITSDTVTIRGTREKMEEIEDGDYYAQELFWGSFSRSVILPEEINPDEAEAALRHGLLTITLPKKKRGVVQKLKVKVT